MDNPLSAKLQAYYDKLPEKVEDIPDYVKNIAEFKHFVLDLRPYVSPSLSLRKSVIKAFLFSPIQANEYLQEINKKKLPTISITKPMSYNSAKREFNTVKKAIEDRDKFNKKQFDKRWALAKKKALNLKRSELRKEARDKAAAEKKRLVEAAKAKAEQQKREKAEAAKEARKKAGQDDVDDDDDGGDGSGSEEEVVRTHKSASRSQPAPSASTLPAKAPRSKRPYLPHSDVESRFGVILGEVQKIWTEISGMKLDFERAERVSSCSSRPSQWSFKCSAFIGCQR